MAASTVMLPFFRVDADALPVCLDLYMLDNKGISLSEFIESFSFHFFMFSVSRNFITPGRGSGRTSAPTRY